MFSITAVTFTNVLWTLSILIGTYIAKSIAQLNERMAVVVEKVTTHDTVLKEHAADIKTLIKKMGE